MFRLGMLLLVSVYAKKGLKQTIFPSWENVFFPRCASVCRKTFLINSKKQFHSPQISEKPQHQRDSSFQMHMTAASGEPQTSSSHYWVYFLAKILHQFDFFFLCLSLSLHQVVFVFFIRAWDLTTTNTDWQPTEIKNTSQDLASNVSQSGSNWNRMVIFLFRFLL